MTGERLHVHFFLGVPAEWSLVDGISTPVMEFLNTSLRPKNLLAKHAEANEHSKASRWKEERSSLEKVEIMNVLKISFAGAVLLLAAPSAIGANVEGKERAAKRACLIGDVDKGAGILADLYVDTNDATYIYNQGRCFEQNGKNDQAVLRFKEYLRKAKNLPQADSDAVLKKIDELQSTAGKHETEAALPPAAQPSRVPSTTSPPASAIPSSAAATTRSDPLGISQSATPSEPLESPPVYKRWWFWTGIGAVLAGGVVTGVLLSKSAPKSPTCDGLGTCVP